MAKGKNPTPLPVFAASNFAKKTWETFIGKCYKSSTVRENYKLGSLRMSISNFFGHMRSIKLNFSATVLTLGLKAKIFENFRLC